jgi:antitoxin FitA
MAMLTVRNVPAAVHRALKLRAARHGRSTEAEVRAILEEAMKPSGSLKLGTLLAAVGRRANVTEEEVTTFEHVREKRPARRVSFE